MRIPFQDTRSMIYRRREDFRKVRPFRINEICEWIEDCDTFSKEDLRQLRSLIDRKLKGFYEFRCLD